MLAQKPAAPANPLTYPRLELLSVHNVSQVPRPLCVIELPGNNGAISLIRCDGGEGRQRN